MFEPTFRMRRTLALVVTTLAVLLVMLLAWLESSRLGEASFFTGITLLSTVFLLALIGIRRRVPVLRLGSMSTWTQVHLYMGLFSVAVYLIHVPAVLGSGMFESALSIAFLSVAISGCYGIYASRTLPKRLSVVEGQSRLDRVGWYRDQIATTAGELMVETEQETESSALGAFYSQHLQVFFGSPPSLAYVLSPTGARRRRLLGGLSELDRYLESGGRQIAGKLAALVRRRDDLDYQYALQLRLRIWVIVHSLMSIALLAGGVIHGIVAWRFSG